MNTALTLESSNGKTGSISVSTTARESCPDTCPLAGPNGCYAEAGYYTRIHWDAVTAGVRGLLPDAFIAAVRKLPTWRVLRHNVAGDLWHTDGVIDAGLLAGLASAAGRLRAAWTYTHHVLTKHNATAIRAATAAGFTVNASCESLTTAAELTRSGMPAVCIVPAGTAPAFRVNGVLFRQCPATFEGSPTQCANCGGGTPLCARGDREFVITFPVHGGKSKAAATACQE
jgi:hypothetical protein